MIRKNDQTDAPTPTPDQANARPLEVEAVDHQSRLLFWAYAVERTGAPRIEVFSKLIRFQLFGSTFELYADPARPYLMQLRLPNVRSEGVANKIMRRFPQAAQGHWGVILADAGAYHAQGLVYDSATGDRLTREEVLAKAIYRAADRMLELAQCFNDHVERATSKRGWHLISRIKTESR